jgi:hypothetical protein
MSQAARAEATPRHLKSLEFLGAERPLLEKTFSSDLDVIAIVHVPHRPPSCEAIN